MIIKYFQHEINTKWKGRCFYCRQCVSYFVAIYIHDEGRWCCIRCLKKNLINAYVSDIPIRDFNAIVLKLKLK